ncbi:hypothetical protein [Enterococcus sp. 2201sp1_2201st1_B8_2201SCRN_220225]|uniref:hypothetical protein n=1 Tax=unclassified Enterococcus TaxID=2608891 RepID=UPI0034A3F8CD
MGKLNIVDPLDELDVNIVNIRNLFTTILRLTEGSFDSSCEKEIRTIAAAGVNFVNECEEFTKVARFE